MAEVQEILNGMESGRESEPGDSDLSDGSDGYRSQAGTEGNWHSPGTPLAVASSLNGCYSVCRKMNSVSASIDEGLILL